jgi:F420-non-reducing hydrogenase iron-sulfur subunit
LSETWRFILLILGGNSDPAGAREIANQSQNLPLKNRKGGEMSASDHKKTKLHIFYCSNCLDGTEFDRIAREEEGVEYTIISLPCSGKADLLYLLKAFETGADGLALVTCPKNECHFLEGNVRAPKRAEAANRLLEEAGMGPDRVTVLSMNGKGTGEIVAKLAAFREKIRSLPA